MKSFLLSFVFLFLLSFGNFFAQVEIDVMTRLDNKIDASFSEFEATRNETSLLKALQCMESKKQLFSDPTSTISKIQDSEEYSFFEEESLNDWIKTRDQSLIYFYIGQSNSYAITITPSKKSFVKLLDSSEIQARSKKFRMECARIPDERNIAQPRFANSSFSLFEALKPALSKMSGIEECIIIPDGALNYIAFDALISQPVVTGQNDFKSLAYLVKSHSITMATSIKELLKSEKEATAIKRGYIGIAPELDGQSFNVDELESARLVLGGSTFIGSEATTSQFESSYEDAGILHIGSKLELSDYSILSKEQFEDNNPFLESITKTETQARLCILHSIQISDIESGQSMVNAYQQFSNSGCPAMALGMWTCLDSSTQVMMTPFYEGIKNKVGITKSLAIAKRSYLELARESKTHPYYWAGMTVIGSELPVSVSGSMGIGTIVFLVLLVASVLLMFSRKRKRKA